MNVYIEKMHKDIEEGETNQLYIYDLCLFDLDLSNKPKYPLS